MAKENENGQERSEQPSSKRIRDAREKGQVCKSVEVSTCLLFLSTVITFYFYIPALAGARERHGVSTSATLRPGTELYGMVTIFRQAVIQLGIMVRPCSSSSWPSA